jgi:uncharacterized membrane protein
LIFYILLFFFKDVFMKKQMLVTSALASVLALGLVQTAAAADTAGKEKCFGVAKAGKNDCASLSGTHSCAGQAKADAAADDWNYVAAGSCKSMGGKSLEEAKAGLKK